MLKIKMILPILILALAALACNLPSQTGQTPTPTSINLEQPATTPSKSGATPTKAGAGPTATSQAKSTATQAPSPEPQVATATQTDMLEFSYKGVKLSYKKGLFFNVTGQIAPLEENDPNTPGWPGSVPEHYQIDFEGYPLQDTFHKPQILLYPVKAYAAANPAAGDIAKALDDALRVDKLPSKLPFLPMWNAAQVYVASPQILAFQSGRGVRYLSCYAQAIVPVGNGCIFYTYQGLTADGNYYLSVVMPIRLDTLDLPEYKDKFDYATMDGPKYEAYLKEMLNVITAAKPEEFSPSMSELDALVKSVLATPEVVLKGVEGTTGVNCPGALASRLRSNMHIRVTFTDGTPLRLRDGAGKTATVLLTIPEGGKMMVVDGPQCVNAGVWWKVKLDSGGQTGWVLEGEDNVYFIEPVP